MTAVFGKMTSMVPNMSAFTQKMMGSSDKDLYGKFEDENTNFEKVNVDIDNLGRVSESLRWLHHEFLMFTSYQQMHIPPSQLYLIASVLRLFSLLHLL